MTGSHKKSIVFIGASGFIGGALYRSFKKNLSADFKITGTYCSSHTATDIEKLDIMQFSDLERFLIKVKPDFIVLTAGNKDVRQCEEDFSRVYALNTRPVESIITIITRHRLLTRVLYFSTDYVFDGKKGYYSDCDIPNPTTNYGKTKYLSEQLLLSSGLDFKIIRTAAVMGRGGIFFNWILDTIMSEKPVSMYENIFFSPTPLAFLTNIVERIINSYDQIPQKILHVAGEKRMSRYHFAILVKDSLKSDVTIRPEKNLDTSLLFQYDLSLVSSDIINKWREKKFEDYLEDEILNAPVCE